jgi:hypothetical protein
MAKKSKQELNKMHWRDRYEYESRRETESLENYSEEQLVNRIENNRLGSYFSIWRAIGKKGTVEGSAMVLWRFLQRSPGESLMLHRYHCAAALFTILGMADPASQGELRKGVQWDSYGEEARQKALLKLQAIIELQLGGSRQD